jgi:hypothetical protein
LSKSTIATLKGESKGFDKVRKDLDRTSDSTQQLDRRTTRLGQSSASSARSFSSQASGLGGLVGVYAAAAANVFAITAAFDALGRAAQAEQIVRGTKILALEIGQNGTTILETVQKITQSQLTLAESAQNINIALSAGFNTEQIEALSEVSLKASRALGRNLTDAFQRVVRGAAKLEPELLDELGIFTRIDPAVEAYASKLNIATNSLTNYEKRQAFVNAVIEEGQKKFSTIDTTVDNSQKKFEQLRVQLTELALEFGQLIAGTLGPIVDFFKNNIGNALLLFGGILSLVFGRALKAIGGFAVNGISQIGRFAEFLADKAKIAQGTLGNLTKAINQPLQGEGGGLTGIRTAPLKGQDVDQAARFKEAIELQRSGQVGSVSELNKVNKAYKEQLKILSPNTKSFKNLEAAIARNNAALATAGFRAKAFIAISNFLGISVSGLTTAFSVLAGAINALFLAFAVVQLAGTLFDVDLLAAIKGLFVDMSKRAEELKAGLTGITAAVGGAGLVNELKRLGATEEELEKLDDRISDINDTVIKFTKGIGINSVNLENLDEILKNFGATSGNTRDKVLSLGFETRKLAGLQAMLAAEEANKDKADLQRIVLLENLIEAQKRFGSSAIVIGGIADQLGLSTEKTSGLLEGFITVLDDKTVIDFAGGIDITDKSLKDLSKTQSDIIVNLTLLSNSLDSAEKSFESGAATAETLSKKLGGAIATLQKLRDDEKELDPFGERDSGAVRDAQERVDILEQQVRTLKTLETNTQALDKVFGKFGNTLDTALAQGLIGFGGLAKDANDIAQNQINFLKSQTEFAGNAAQAEKIRLALATENGERNSEQVVLVQNREKALKAILGLSIDLAQNIEKETKARQKTLDTLASQLVILRLQRRLQNQQADLKLLKEQQKTLEQVGKIRIDTAKKELDATKELDSQLQKRFELEQKLTEQAQKRRDIVAQTSNQQNIRDFQNAQAARQSNITAQQSAINTLDAFPNLRSDEQARQAREQLIQLEKENQLAALKERERIAKFEAANATIALMNQRKLLQDENENNRRRIAAQLDIQAQQAQIRQKEQAAELVKLQNDSANLEKQRAIIQTQQQIEARQIDAREAEFTRQNKLAAENLETLRIQEKTINGFRDGVENFAKSVEAFLIGRGFSQEDAQSMVGQALGNLSSDFKLLEDLQTAIETLQGDLISEQRGIAGDKQSQALAVLDEQISRNETLLELTAKRQVIENRLEILKSAAAVQELEDTITLNNSQISTINQQIKLEEEKLQTTLNAIDIEKDAVVSATAEKLKSIERERAATLRLVNDLVGALNDGVGKALETIFDNIAEGKKVGEGLRDVLFETFENVRKTILKQTLIEPVQNFISESVGSFFGIGKKGADNASIVTTAAGDALLVSLASGGIDDPSSGVGKLLSGLDEAKQKSGEVATEQKGFFDSILEGFQTAGTGVKDFFGSIFSSLSGMFGGGSGSGGGGIFSMFSGMLGQGGLNFGQLFGGPSNAMLATGAATHSTALAMQQGIPFIPGSDFGSAGMFLASGGLVKRYAGGGNVISQDRVPALLQPGEFVMKRSAVNAMGANNMAMMNATGKSNGNVVVNIKNEGTPQDAQASQPKFDGEKMVIDIVTRDLRNNGPIRKSLRGGST